MTFIQKSQTFPFVLVRTLTPIILSVSGFDVAKTGDARIGFVGFPSVGKSTLLSNLAGVYSEVAAYEFTTLTTVPGVIRYKGAKIQVFSLKNKNGLESNSRLPL